MVRVHLTRRQVHKGIGQGTLEFDGAFEMELRMADRYSVTSFEDSPVVTFADAGGRVKYYILQ
jgi:hypothetical protein